MFESLIKNKIMPSQNIYIKKNTIDLLKEILKKVHLSENYAIESFVMYLDYFTYQDYFNDVKIYSMTFLEEFFKLL
jgi:hypothetical protein